MKKGRHKQMAWTSIPAKTDIVFDRLTKAAREMRTVRYADLADECGLAAAGIGMQLGYIRDEVCRAKGLPWLTAIAVASKYRSAEHDRLLP